MRESNCCIRVFIHFQPFHNRACADFPTSVSYLSHQLSGGGGGNGGGGGGRDGGDGGGGSSGRCCGGGCGGEGGQHG